MTRRGLLQVVPAVRSGGEGLSDYAAQLGCALESAVLSQDLGDATAICEDKSELKDPEPGERAGARQPAYPQGLGPNDALLLHYVGYGYDPRGVPRGLIAGVERLRRAAPGARIGVMFHEVWATGPPWRSSFWTFPIQKALVRRLLAAADAAVTTLPIYRKALDSCGTTTTVEVLAIPSTVGEPPSRERGGERSPVMVLFGSSGVRKRAWGESRSALEAAVHALGCIEIVDIGAPCGAPDWLGQVPVRARGALPAPVVVEELLRAGAGFLAYPPEFLGKSTVFAAYQACGLIPVVAWSGLGSRRPGPGEAWLHATRDGLDSDADPDEVARKAFAAYAERSISRHADLWQRLLIAR